MPKKEIKKLNPGECLRSLELYIQEVAALKALVSMAMKDVNPHLKEALQERINSLDNFFEN